MAFLSISKAVLLICGIAASAIPTPQIRPGTPRTTERRLAQVNWLELDTDACGKLDRVQTRNNAPKTVRASDTKDDDEEWENAWDMSPSDSVRMNDWFSEHPDIATVTSAIQKACNDARSNIDDADEPEIA